MIFSNYNQRVQIDNVLSDLANCICGVPQGSVLGYLKLNYYEIGYQVIKYLSLHTL